MRERGRGGYGPYSTMLKLMLFTNLNRIPKRIRNRVEKSVKILSVSEMVD